VNPIWKLRKFIHLRLLRAARTTFYGPREYVGGLWHEIGELQFKFLVEQGLRPEHVLLDIACGSLRGGVRFIAYLDAGNYLGIDLEPDLIGHGRTLELGKPLEEIKRPEFVVSGSFEFDKFSRRPDFAIAQSLFTHLTSTDITLCLDKLRSCAKPNTVLYATFSEVNVPKVNPRSSDARALFFYARDQMDQFGEQCGWRMQYIGDWHHPREQKMVRYELLNPAEAERTSGRP
jgi:hypothetical protein